jgi:hypothetical protein
VPDDPIFFAEVHLAHGRKFQLSAF